ncbi:ogr/Delta-like zinc finger family protein [Endozoicomonas montiporae]|uniref:Zinc finger Ogr/Delta-type domain-containing protein n=1 Tax=Endozoicomonas montiporae CL-33 TaxID=570277 RepID=A0A142BCU3_9GAMM|nr:ogr/Delta-like zinc finger family protein [Endozoicomonas montiporae]AMO56569.1 hypothetical protein EZMO1_2485 [Endozoicomonas montiporae CL-33]
MSHVGTTDYEERPMRVTCPHCRSKSRITDTNTISDSVRELYCICQNADCDARFKMSLAHMNDIRPPKTETDNLLIEFFRRMPLAEKQRLLAQT